MVDPTRLQGVGGPQAADRRQTTPAAADAAGSAAFRALLEKLEASARGLRERSEGLADPAELAGAVDQARVTLEDAQLLGDSLLEAFRAARQRGDGAVPGAE